jgi:uncharacterized protein YjbJ (UPF0337 family)
MAINWNQAEGNWKQFKGKIRQKWGQLTDDEIDEIAGNRDILIGKLQERYGIEQAEVERQVKEFEDTYK